MTSLDLISKSECKLKLSKNNIVILGVVAWDHGVLKFRTPCVGPIDVGYLSGICS